jgi:hypothetical protein
MALLAESRELLADVDRLISNTRALITASPEPLNSATVNSQVSLCRAPRKEGGQPLKPGRKEQAAVIEFAPAARQRRHLEARIGSPARATSVLLPSDLLALREPNSFREFREGRPAGRPFRF